MPNSIRAKPEPSLRAVSPDLGLAVQIERLQRQNQALRRKVEELRSCKEAAYRDPITELRNRRYFDERLGEELARLGRSPERQGAVLLIDVDDFKGINDGYGHAAGDQVLRDVAALLVQTLRLEDVCCRFGGDEFAVILSETTALAAGRVVSRVEEAVGARNATEAIAVHLAIGVAAWPTQGRDAASLLEAADRGMYWRKREGKRARTPAPALPNLKLV